MSQALISPTSTAVDVLDCPSLFLGPLEAGVPQLIFPLTVVAPLHITYYLINA